jgi:hypothetical protein
MATSSCLGRSCRHRLPCSSQCRATPSAEQRSRQPTNDGRSWVPPPKPGKGHARAAINRAPAVILASEHSAALQEQLLTELANIASTELAANWARVALAAKNSLVASDAKLVEGAFERRLAERPLPSRRRRRQCYCRNACR